MVRQKPTRDDSFLVFLKYKYLFVADNRDIRKGSFSCVFRPFQANALLLYPLKTSENLWFSGSIEVKHWPETG